MVPRGIGGSGASLPCQARLRTRRRPRRSTNRSTTSPVQRAPVVCAWSQRSSPATRTFPSYPETGRGDGQSGRHVVWSLHDLTPALRGHAVAEARADIARNALYSSKLAKPGTDATYQRLLLAALENGTTESFAEAIWNSAMLRPNKDGMPHKDAHERLAGGEYVRFYLRGLCLLADDRNIRELEIYRAKLVAQPRPESQARIGQRVLAAKLLEDLRANIGVDTVLGVPSGANSGLCARFPR